jgi:hypothetical protein
MFNCARWLFSLLFEIELSNCMAFLLLLNYPHFLCGDLVLIKNGLFTTYVGLHKRKEHGLETWALFIDLVKAFDTVPREALFAILHRFGLPDHFVNIDSPSRERFDKCGPKSYKAQRNYGFLTLFGTPPVTTPPGLLQKI